MRYLAVALCGLVLACSSESPSEPEPEPFSLSLTGELTGQDTTDSGLECTYTLRARADGGPAGAFAQWEGGDAEFYHIPSGEWRGTITFTRARFARWFGSDRVPTGKTATASRVAFMPDSTPYTLDHSFQYSVSDTGEIRTVGWEFRCE